MDLIYADKNKIEQGVILDCSFDCSFGYQENDFECTVDMDNHVCQEDCFIYFDQTQYGGIIDRIAVSTKNHTVTYMGRTWHGILNSRVLCPPAGDDYLVLTGEANSVIAEIVNLVNLENIFTVSEEDSGLYIPGFQVRYEYAYLAILKMLSEVNGKLMFVHDGNYVKLSVENVADYSTNEEFDSTQVGFNAEKAYNVVNHFICLGSGNLRDRYVIHLFTNENGEIQPYATREQPLSDTDYILDESGKVMTGNEERVYVYDYNNAQTTENYVALQTKPANWKNAYTGYYVYDDENEDYKALEKEYADKYVLTKSKPADWIQNYLNYFYKSGSEYKCISGLVSGKAYEVLTEQPDDWNTEYGSYFYLKDGEYKKAALVETVTYKALKKQPNDWKKNYAEYFYLFTDGVNIEYRSIEGRKKDYYVVQTRKPTDWSDNYNGYFELNAKGKYVAVTIKSYKRLTEKPSDWNAKYGNYFYYFTDGVNKEYRSIQGKQKDTYTVQEAKPTDWADNYNNYYEKDSNGKYVAVTVQTYIALSAQPDDWSKNYKEYYYIYSDGTSSEYRQIQGITTDKYILQTNMPTDWYSNYDSYYYYDSASASYKKVAGIKVSDISEEVAPAWAANTYYTKETVTKAPAFTSFSKVYKKGDAPTWKADTYYTKGSKTVAPSYESFKRVYRVGDPPKWKKKHYYTKEQKTVTPKFDVHPKVYKKVTTTSVPVWKAGTYYDEYTTNDLTWEKGKYYICLENQEIIPVFTSGKYFERYLDHYADLVANATEKIKEIYDCDSIDIDLSLEENYDIGDIVGSTEVVTGISVWQPITQKIVKIKDKEETIEYEIGVR